MCMEIAIIDVLIEQISHLQISDRLPRIINVNSQYLLSNASKVCALVL